MEGSKQNHGSSSSSDEKRLELRLGPPGEHDWITAAREDLNSGQDRLGELGSDLPQGYLSNMNKYYFQRFPSQSSQYTRNNVPNSSQKRSAPAPVVGWPPIRSFRKNLATSNSSKSLPESENAVTNKALSEKKAEKSSTQKGFLVKINMEGVPIGRKVDLTVHDSYEKLSSAVDDLFRGLLAAQRDSCDVGIKNKQEKDKEIIKGLVDGISGEYTLVYEDNEGDRMLLGDVPWNMFVSTVKRLRVLKTSELSTLSFKPKQAKISLVADPN